MWLFTSLHIFVLTWFLSTNVQAQKNDNSVFILAVGTPNNTITQPVGCDATFWLSTGEQINPPDLAPEYLESSTGPLILSNDEWWWLKPNGDKINKDDTKYKNGYVKENRWDPWNLYNGIHYYLTITALTEDDVGEYTFVINYNDQKRQQQIDRHEVFYLTLPNHDIYCPNKIAFGARPGGEILRYSSAWSEGNTNEVTDNILMVGPFTPTTGNPRERFQITSLDINGIEIIETGTCMRFGFNFKIQIFTVDEDAGTATVVRQQDLVAPWDAYKSKVECTTSDCDRARFIGEYVKGQQSSGKQDWNHLVIPVWYARGPFLIEKDQYVGISTQGCLQFRKGNDKVFSNVPNQKAFFVQTGTTAWKYGYAGQEQTYYTAYPAPLDKPVGPLREAIGPWSFTFHAKFYDIKPLPPVEDFGPVVRDNSISLYILIALAALSLCCCFLCCCLSAKNHKRTRERRRFMNEMLGQSCNISSETGEPLPPNWYEEKAPNGVAYYYNPVSNESMWDIPCFG